MLQLGKSQNFLELKSRVVRHLQGCSAVKLLFRSDTPPRPPGSTSSFDKPLQKRSCGRDMEKDHSIKSTTVKGATISHAGGGGKIPYNNRADSHHLSTDSSTATPNMFGHRLEDGMRNLRTGRPIQQSWLGLSLVSQQWHGTSALSGRCGQGFRRRGGSTRVDGGFLESQGAYRR